MALGGISIGIALCYQEKLRDENHGWFSKRYLHPSVTWNQANQTFDNHTKSTKQQSATVRKTKNRTNSSTPKKIYDFIVIGYGNAGRGAVEALQQQCPSAKVVVIDPFRISPKKETTTKNTSSIDHIPARAIGIRPREHTIEIAFSEDGQQEYDDPVQQQIQFRCAALIATGARGAPPPSYLVEEPAWNRILEMRPTIIPNKQQNHRPVLSPQNVRERIRTSVRAGKTIGVLGCGWDAVDIVLEASLSSPSSKSKSITHSLIFGSSAPLSNVLPNYLSAALVKRLKSKGIEIQDRSVVRYVTHNDVHDALQLYTAKSYDMMDGHSARFDLLVIAPDVHGARGTATMPTDEVPEFLEESSKGRSWYQTWSNLSVTSTEDTSLLSCYKEDGRIAVNSELNVCTGLFAAGSVAKCANGMTGHAVVAGVGIVDGKAAGYAAGMNMAHLYNVASDSPYNIFRSGSGSLTNRRNKLTLDPIPIWRSDLRSQSCDNMQDQYSCLSEAGVTALCVGNCDSESLVTHGVWWTNLASQRRLQNLFDATPSDDDDHDAIHKKMQARKRIRKALKPVYGLGVVFYLNRVGRIHGVMTWGLPFTRLASDRRLNEELVTAIKSIIKTNGGIRILETELDHLRMSEYLTKASKELVAIAFAGQSAAAAAHSVDGASELFPRPLHRFTEVRSPSVRSVGILRRKDGHGQGILGEDLFVRYEDDSMPDTPPPALHPAKNVGFAVKNVEARYNWSVCEQTEKRWDENEARARPPKEDPLWIRKGDETRNISHAERMNAAYKSHLNAFPPG